MQNVQTNAGKIVLKLVKKHFPKNHMLHKLFTCMPNIATIISGHNKQVLNPKQETHSCNCRRKTECPLSNECLTPSVIYQAEIKNDKNNDKKTCIGASATPFKERFRNHIKDRIVEIHLGTERQRNDTNRSMENIKNNSQ